VWSQGEKHGVGGLLAGVGRRASWGRGTALGREADEAGKVHCESSGGSREVSADVYSKKWGK